MTITILETTTRSRYTITTIALQNDEMQGFTHTLQHHAIRVVTGMPASCMQLSSSRAERIFGRFRSKSSDWKRKARNEDLIKRE
jgi:hypothetical protein